MNAVLTKNESCMISVSCSSHSVLSSSASKPKSISPSAQMASAMQLNVKPVRLAFHSRLASKHSHKPTRIKCAAAAATPSKRYSITLLPGDGIGPEVISVAKNVLKLAGSLEGLLNTIPATLVRP